MTDFAFTVLVEDPHADIQSAALGPNSSTKFTEADIGKPVKLGTADNYVLCAAGDEPEGFVFSISPETVNDGFSFGSVQKNMRIEAEVDVAIDGTATNEAVVVGEYVIAGTSAALGTAETSGLPQVRDGAATDHKWRIIKIITGAGLAGSKILIEKV